MFISVQKYLSQYKNIFPIQKYLSQYKNIFPLQKIFIPAQKYFSSTNYLSQYKNIFPVQKYLFQYKIFYPSSNVMYYSSCKIFPMLHCSPGKVPAKTRWPYCGSRTFLCIKRENFQFNFHCYC